jgi:hypothetical protein
VRGGPDFRAWVGSETNANRDSATLTAGNQKRLLKVEMMLAPYLIV